MNICNEFNTGTTYVGQNFRVLLTPYRNRHYILSKSIRISVVALTILRAMEYNCLNLWSDCCASDTLKKCTKRKHSLAVCRKFPWSKTKYFEPESNAVGVAVISRTVNEKMKEATLFRQPRRQIRQGCVACAVDLFWYGSTWTQPRVILVGQAYKSKMTNKSSHS